MNTTNAALIAALEDAARAINSMKVEAETAAQGDEQMMLEACEQISNEGLAASEAIRAAIASTAAQPTAGWVTVPVEPTNAMRAVIDNEHDVYESADALYAALLAAAPKAEPADQLQQLTELSERAGLYDADFGKPAVAPAAPAAVAESSELQAEAAKLATILHGMVEGGATDGETDIYADDYEPPDGDVYVYRAAEVLAALAAAPTTQAAPQQEARELCPSCRNGDFYACTCPFPTSRTAAPQPPAKGQEPVAYAIFANNGNIRLWSKKPLPHPDAQPLYTHPAPTDAKAAPVAQGDALTPAEADQLEKAITDFEECGETDVPDAALQRFAAMGYLECVHYNVLPAAHKAIDAARSQAKEGGAA